MALTFYEYWLKLILELQSSATKEEYYERKFTKYDLQYMNEALELFAELKDLKRIK